MKHIITVYGPGGHDPGKPHNNVVESYEVDVPTPQPTVEDALKAAARLAVEARVKADDLDDATVSTLALLYDQWQPGEAVTVGDLRAHDGTIVEALQAHTTQADWTPDRTPALWKVHRRGSTTNPDPQPDPWQQPTGAHDAYALGDRVTHKGGVWASLIPANTTEPGSDPRWWRAEP